MLNIISKRSMYDLELDADITSLIISIEGLSFSSLEYLLNAQRCMQKTFQLFGNAVSLLHCYTKAQMTWLCFIYFLGHRSLWWGPGNPAVQNGPIRSRLASQCPLWTPGAPRRTTEEESGKERGMTGGKKVEKQMTGQQGGTTKELKYILLWKINLELHEKATP